MSTHLKTSMATVAIATLLTACTPAENTKTAASGETQMAANADMSGGMSGEKMSGPQTPFTPSEDKMHQDMMQATGRDVEETYARKMIAHHRGAIEMSEVVLRENPDAQLRAMAEKTIADQGLEITMLEQWIEQRPNAGASTTPERAG